MAQSLTQRPPPPPQKKTTQHTLRFLKTTAPTTILHRSQRPRVRAVSHRHPLPWPPASNTRVSQPVISHSSHKEAEDTGTTGDREYPPAPAHSLALCGTNHRLTRTHSHTDTTCTGTSGGRLTHRKVSTPSHTKSHTEGPGTDVRVTHRPLLNPLPTCRTEVPEDQVQVRKTRVTSSRAHLLP